MRKNLSSFALHVDCDFNNHVGVQCHAHSAFAHCFDGAMRHTDLSFSHSETFFCQRFSDVMVGHRAEQTTVHTSFLAEFDDFASQFLALGLCSSQFLSSSFFEFSAANFEFFDCRLSGATCTA